MPNTPAHTSAEAGGSPLYQVSAEHIPGLVLAAVVLAAGAWLLRRRGAPQLAPVQWLLVALLGTSVAIHTGLALGHDGHGGGIRALFLIDAALLGVVARRVLHGSRPGGLGAAVLFGSVGAYWVSAIAGTSPDQVGLATKLCELLALAIVLRPAPASRWRPVRAFAGSGAICALVVLTAAGSWAGAFRASASEPGHAADHHVHGGSVPRPGTLLPAVPLREPTAAERTAAASLLQATRAALARYADPALAAADGYKVVGLAGLDFHATNPAHENDGRFLDPAHPETLVYAVAPDGRPVLMGAMFMMPMGRPGPTIGGPLTVWHGHEHICVSLTPPGLAGLLSPLGGCPIGTIDIPKTAEMIHLWTVPGAPQPYGDLDDAWKRAYLEATVARP